METQQMLSFVDEAIVVRGKRLLYSYTCQWNQDV